MAATERLYYGDSRLLEFDACVVDVSQRDDGAIAIALDRTAFYPTGGGQPNDTGTIGDARVIDCIDLEDEGVLHVLQGPTPEIGDQVHGRIDWLRRLDHLQQHTGQHILSAAFVRLFSAPTHSFRVLEDECEIDVELPAPTDELIEPTVDLPNQIIWESRPIRIQQVTAAAATSLPLRKEPARAGELRVIEIDDFDLTPCGGTHAKSTGEVGIIGVRGWERAKGLARIQFMAGLRLLADYRKVNRTAREVAELFSAGRDDTAPLVTKLLERNRTLQHRVEELEESVCRSEAEELIKNAMHESQVAIQSESTVKAGGPKATPIVIARTFDNRSADSLKLLGLALIKHANVVALLGSRDDETARLFFARSADAAGDMNELMRAACATIDGRGGGKPEIAQGGGKNIGALDQTIRESLGKLTRET